MLVERTLNGIGWKETDMDINDKELSHLKDTIERFENEPCHTYIFNKGYKFVKSGNDIKVYLYEVVGYDDLIKKIESVEGFTIPTENEWEYLCGGGNPTLFPWGNYFDYDKMNLKYFPQNSKEPYTLEQPNHFGISIAYDPYKCEVVNSLCMFKGGDGGCNICGGLGILWGYLPVATYLRCYDGVEDELDYKADIGGDYTSYRRIFRLDNKK